MIIIRPHRMHVVQRSGPCGSVYLLVIGLIVSPKNGRTDRDAVWVVDLGGLNKLCVRLGLVSQKKGVILGVVLPLNCI